MMIKLKQYRSTSRIALVDRGLCFNCGAINHEVLQIKENELIFCSDDLHIDINESEFERLDILNHGDIVTITDDGRLSVMFDSSERSATVFMTGECNSNCLMCPSGVSERIDNQGYPESWLYTYIDMLPASLEHIVVTGGEPTLRGEAFWGVMKRLADKFQNIEVLLLTNGRTMSLKRYAERLASYCPQFLKVAIPINGPTADIHDAVTQSKGSFNQSVQGIRNLLALEIPVEIRIVVTKMNYDSLVDIAQLIIDKLHNVTVVNFVGMETRGSCAKNLSSVYVEQESVFQYIRPAVELLIADGIDVMLYNYPLCYVDQGFWPICKRSISPEKVRYAMTCEGCEVKDACSGFFMSTLAAKKLKGFPIHFEGNEIC